MKNHLSVWQSAGMAALGGMYFLLGSCATDANKKNNQKLNVVFFLADDLRWNSLGCAGNKILTTPNIDALARNGVRFSNACVTTSISMVSRANLLTVGFFATHAQDNHPDQYLYQPESEEYYSNTVIPVPETASDKYFNLLPPFLSNEKNEGRIRWHWRFDTPEKYQKYMKAYYRMLTELDIAVGEITAELKKQGVLENTLIIFMGDNGYFHSEHGLADKWYPYQESIKVPLVVCDPRLSRSRHNTVNEEFVLNIDIAPAIIAAAGLPVPETMQGKDFSILYLNDKKEEWRQQFFYEHPFVTSEQRIPSSEALVTHSEKYIYWSHYNYEEYFDLVKDPHEIRNAIKDSTFSEKIEAMKNRFVKLREQAE